MNVLKDIWNERFNREIKALSRYAQLIVNDHLSLILLVALGIFAYSYQNQYQYLSSLTPETMGRVLKYLVQLVLIGLLVLVQEVGQPYWLTVDPDKSFLMPLGREWNYYWLRSLRVGLVIPMVLALCIGAVVYPFVSLVTPWSLGEMVYFILWVFLSRLNRAANQYLRIFSRGLPPYLLTLLVTALYALSFNLPQPYHLVLAMGSATLMTAIFLYWRSQAMKEVGSMEEVVALERLRIERMTKLLSVFVDIPSQASKIRRLAFLDPLLAFWTKDKYELLLSRLISRNTTYSQSTLNLTFFVSLLMVFVRNETLILMIGIAALFLTAIQLAPAIRHYSLTVFMQLYPRTVNEDTWLIRAFKRVSFGILGLQSLIFALFALLYLGWFKALVFCFLWLVAAYIILETYMPFRLRRILYRKY